jgi:hypothetical protein
MIRPGTDWENEAPRILCESVVGVGTVISSTLIGAAIGGGPFGAAIGAIIGAASRPSLDYALCGGYESTSPPLDGENELPEPNTTLNVQISRTITVEISKPPTQLDVEITRTIYKEDNEFKEPGSTKFPLYKAISARESLKNRKFGCILYQPVSDERIKLSKCNIQRPSNNPELDDKQRLINFVVAQESNTLATGVCIMSTINQGKVNTGIVVGPYILSATATAYAAFNKQMYSAPITKIPKGVEYESCTIPPPSIDVPFSIKKDTRVKFEPFVEITSPLAGVSN